ncbi:unnamed protein product [Rotaria sp. Silwood2]|nr:unnamed protein product [Rotaria sp. Silwood2]CAF4000675.1 unnamed protein product [Rotaria sp. Silwood2]
MVQPTVDQYKNFPYQDSTSKLLRKPKTTVIVYDQPKVVIVRRYTRTIVPSVDPDQYKKQYDDVLLDAPTLMKWIRCLKIEENMINLPPVE